ncbi:MAG: U32 family peptidase [Acidobacteriota bacterium]|nr:U32 family peptidase [Blastocatellia bacterium]MDW8240963.1 U32 family peptidase [Acidobacteriota bacterium]
MEATRRFLETLNLPSRDDGTVVSEKRFPDGGQYRIEIPEVETPAVFEVVIKMARDLGVPIHRVSQGTGISLLTDAEIRAMAEIGARERIEVFLFVNPRTKTSLGAHGLAPKRLYGADQLVYAVEDVKRACRLGIRGVLVADEGLVFVLNAMRQEKLLPETLKIKTSVLLTYSNPASSKVLETLGVNSFNVAADLPLSVISSIRQALTIPIDIYIEVPVAYGGTMRYHELPEIVKMAAPVYLKFGLYNEVSTDPIGEHLLQPAIEQARERVRRAKIGLELLAHYYPEAKASPTDGIRGGIPEIE